MPELPEIETTCRAIRPYLVEQTIKHITIRHQQLRLPVSSELVTDITGQIIEAVVRRAKYLLLQLSQGYLLIHLGMSGHLRFISNDNLPGKHDHIDLELQNGLILRYNDPRRFGLWVYIDDSPFEHKLLKHLGPEPLLEDFNTDYLAKRALHKTQSVKAFIMDNTIVVGVGNIYATESLFLAGIHPLRPAGSLTLVETGKLVIYIKQVLHKAIAAGGTTLKDFYSADGKPGYFAQDLMVYGRQNKKCFQCDSILEHSRIAGRNSTFCPVCQPISSVQT